MEHGGPVHVHTAYGHGIGIGAIVGIGSVFIDDSPITAVSQEIQGEVKIARLAVGHSADVPVLGTALLTGIYHIFAHCCTGYQGALPVGGHILDELEGGLVLVVLNLIGRHVARAVDNDVLGQLVGQCVLGVRAGNCLVAVFKNAGREVHRTAQTACERQNALMIRRVASLSVKGVVFLAAHTLGGDEVGPRALYAAGHSALVIDNHQMITGCGLDNLAEVAYAPLRVLQLAVVEM